MNVLKLFSIVFLIGTGHAFLFESSKVQIHCYPAIIEVSLDNLVENETHMQLLDSNCNKKSQNSKVDFTFPLDECGTIIKNHKSWTKYTNIIKPVIPDENCPFQKIRFSCKYSENNRVKRRTPRGVNGHPSYEITRCNGSLEVGPMSTDGILTDRKRKKKVHVHHKEKKTLCPELISVGEALSPQGILTSREVSKMIPVKPQGKKLCKALEGRGKFHVSMQIFTNDNYEDLLITEMEKTKTIQDFANVYYQVSTQKSSGTNDANNDIVLTLRNCYATPTENPDDEIKYTILEDGCPVDETFQLHPTDSTRVVRFSIKSFLFLRSNSRQFFMHCQVKICDKTDQSSCSTGCNDIKKKLRSLYKRNEANSVVTGNQFYLVCKHREFQVYLPKPLPGNIAPTDLHLLDPACTPTENETHVIFKSQLSKCDTSFVNSHHAIQYQNVILENMADKIIYRGDFFRLPIKCTYKKSFNLAPIKLNFVPRASRLRSKAFGSYKVDIAIFEDETYTRKFSNSLVEVDPTEDMFFEIRIISQHFKLSMFLDRCYGEPMYQSYDREQYTFIKEGCAADDTLRFLPSDDSSKIRFSMKPFTFDRDYSNVRINCLVTACNSEIAQSKCNKGCQNK